jgi:small conductance mechanosensitive channel
MEIRFANISIDIFMIIVPLIYIILGINIFRLIKNILMKFPKKTRILRDSQLQRIKTIKLLILNIIKYIIITIVILAILSKLGVNVKSILAGLGIGTAIIGLAFQDLAKDLISGFTIITEGEYEVGDTIEVQGFMGKVSEIGLRTTRIVDFKGATKIIANHYMDNIINYSNNNSLAVIDVGIAYENNEKEIEMAFKNLFERLKDKIPNATKEPEVWGVQELSDSSVIYRIVVETKPMKHLETERFMKKEIKKEFDSSKIKIPYTQIEVHNGK